MRTVLRDPMSWVAAALSLAAALGVASQFPVGPVQLGGLVVLALVLALGWIGLAALTGRYRDLQSHETSTETRAWAERQARRVDSLKLGFGRLRHDAGAQGVEALARSFAAFSRALGVHRPRDAARHRAIGQAGRDAYQGGLDLLEDLATRLETLDAIGRATPENARGEEILGAVAGRAGALADAAMALTDGSDNALDGATRRLASPPPVLPAADTPPPPPPPPDR